MRGQKKRENKNVYMVDKKKNGIFLSLGMCPQSEPERKRDYKKRKAKHFLLYNYI